MTLGVLTGLSAATLQAFSYICSRFFNNRFKTGSQVLLILSHIIMAVFSLVLLPFFIPTKMPLFSDYILPTFVCAFAYLVGQACIFVALKKAQASVVSPLLGIKIIILAFISKFVLSADFSITQWLAVGISAISVMMLRRSGETIPTSVLVWVFLGCTGYSVSDIFIRKLLDIFEPAGLMSASMTTTCIVNIMRGLISCVLYRLADRASVSMWVGALPFAATWFRAMVF